MSRWNAAAKREAVARVKAIFDSKLTGIKMREVEAEVGASHTIIGRLFTRFKVDGKIVSHGSGHSTTWNRTDSPWDSGSLRRQGLGNGAKRVIRRLRKSPPVPQPTTLLERCWGRGLAVPCGVCGVMHCTRFCGTMVAGDALSPV
jgi:hypothetical protein